jgi:ubiquinone/menaquinone biosynthesis C-methylase UbiE
MKRRKNKQVSSYSALAPNYDELMASNKYLVWAALIAEVAKRYGIPKGLCIDVACGTGNISAMVVKLGFDVLGVDRSSEMIALAKKKIPQGVFRRADIQHLGVLSKRKAVFAVSFYDSLNYILSGGNMLKVFQGVGRNLAPGAIFLFDMNTPEHVSAAQKYKPRVFEGEKVYSVFRFGGKNRLWSITMDFFLKKGSQYSFLREKHVERGYSKKEIVPLLKKSGFKVIEVRCESKTYEDGKNRPSRLYFIVKKSEQTERR